MKVYALTAKHETLVHLSYDPHHGLCGTFVHSSQLWRDKVATCMRCIGALLYLYQRYKGIVRV